MSAGSVKKHGRNQTHAITLRPSNQHADSNASRDHPIPARRSPVNVTPRFWPRSRRVPKKTRDVPDTRPRFSPGKSSKRLNEFFEYFGRDFLVAPLFESFSSGGPTAQSKTSGGRCGREGCRNEFSGRVRKLRVAKMCPFAGESPAKPSRETP